MGDTPITTTLSTKPKFGFTSQKHLLKELLHITALPFVSQTCCTLQILQLVLDINYDIFWYLLLLKLHALHSSDCISLEH